MWIFSTSKDKELFNIMLLVTRITVALFMLVHGIQKFKLLFSDEPIRFVDPVGIGESASLILTVFAEVVCSCLLLIGLATRLVTIPLIITMFIVVFIVHSSDGFERQELPGLYLLVFLLLLITGSGKYSIDYLISRKKKSVNY